VDTYSDEDTVFWAFEISGPLAALWVPLDWLGSHAALHWVAASFLGEALSDISPNFDHIETDLR
jgi:hypothetical protein